MSANYGEEASARLAVRHEGEDVGNAGGAPVVRGEDAHLDSTQIWGPPRVRALILMFVQVTSVYGAPTVC